MQGKNGDVDIENRLVDMEGGREGGTSGESSMKTYFAYLKQIASGNLLNEQGVSANLVLSDNL